MSVASFCRCAGPIAFAALVTLLPNSAEAKLPREIKIGNQSVVLNGKGTRTKTFVSIYESGLYLLSPSSDAEEILAADQLMAIRIQILSGFVSRAKLVSSLLEGLKKSTDGKIATIEKETQLFLSCLKDEVKKNDIYDFVYRPSQGLYILKNGKMLGNVPGLAFKQAFFGIWLSDQPVDKDLRTAMLRSATKR